MNRYRYEFANLQTGKPCCKTNDLTRLCASCRARAGSVPAPGAPVIAAATNDAPPDAPSPIARLGGPEVMMSPVFGGGPRHEPLVVATGVPEVPSLTDAIRAARKGGR